MTIIMLIAVIAAAFGLVGTRLVRHFALKIGFIAHPKADRAHTEPTALMGGLAIYGAATGATLLITVIATQMFDNPFRLGELTAIIAGASLMAGIGLWDDRRALPAWAKLGLQLLPVLLLFSLDVRVNIPITGDPLWDDVINFGITTVWILYITNAVNYLDNADGIAIMTSATTSAIFMLIAILNGQELVSILGAAILGASAGFAVYNFPLPRGTIFMGDSGSLFLGFLLAILGIKLRIPGNVPEVTWLVPIIVLALPIFDTLLVFISRTRRGVSFFRGGVDHTNHRIARLGLNSISVALAVGFLNCVLGLIAIFITQANLVEAYIVAGMLAVGALYALWQLEFSASYHLRVGQKPTPSPVEGAETPPL